MSFLFRIAVVLLTSQRATLLAANDACDAYRILAGLGSKVGTGVTLDALLDAAFALQHPAWQTESLTAMRKAQAAALAVEHPGAATSAPAAHAVAEATATEVLAARHTAAQTGQYGLGEWCLVPALGAGGDEAGEGWSLVEPKPQPANGCSLSYVILQLEAPRLVEEHFGMAVHLNFRTL